MTVWVVIYIQTGPPVAFQWYKIFLHKVQLNLTHKWITNLNANLSYWSSFGQENNYLSVIISKNGQIVQDLWVTLIFSNKTIPIDWPNKTKLFYYRIYIPETALSKPAYMSKEPSSLFLRGEAARKLKTS